MRPVAFDSRIQQIKNKVVNPSFESITGGANIERYRNYSTRPQGNTAWNGLSSGGATFTTVNATTGGPTNICALWKQRIVVTQATTSTFSQGPFTSGTSGMPFTDTSRVYTYSIYGIASYTATANVNAVVRFYDSSGTQIGSAITGASQAVQSGIWQRCSVSAQAPTGTAYVYWILSWTNATAAQVGDYFGTTASQVNVSPYIMPYFDGSSTSSPLGQGFTYTWAGTAAASQSIATGPTPTGVVVTNIAAYPSLENGSSTNIANYAGGGGVVTPTVGTDGGFLGSNYYRLTWTTGTTSSSGGPFYGSTSLVPVTAGSTYMFSAYVRTSKAQTIQPTIPWKKSDGTNSAVQPTGTQGSSFSIPANTWTRVSVSGVVPSDAALAQFTCYAAGGVVWNVGDTMDFDCVMVTAGPALWDYFDGVYTVPGGFWDDPDFYLSWTGTANASSSTAKVLSINSVTTLNCVACSSLVWMQNGSRSVRIIPANVTGTSVDSSITIGGDTGALRMGMEPGKTYTALITCRLSAALTGTIDSRGPGISYNGGAPTSTGKATNAAGVYQLRSTISVAAGATSAFIRLYNGSSAGNGSVWYDSYALIEGKYNGPYFDGTFKNAKWLGTADASESVGYPSSI